MVRPFAVDTASGTEQAPGRKDARKLRDFFGAVAAAPLDGVRASGEAMGRAGIGQPA